MPLNTHLLLAVTLLCCFASMFAIPLEGFIKDHHCRCLKTTNSYINNHSFKRIEIIPSGSHCNNIEIIITLKNKQTVCVAPDADWIVKLISNLKSSRGK